MITGAVYIYTCIYPHIDREGHQGIQNAQDSNRNQNYLQKSVGLYSPYRKFEHLFIFFYFKWEKVKKKKNDEVLINAKIGDGWRFTDPFSPIKISICSDLFLLVIGIYGILLNLMLSSFQRQLYHHSLKSVGAIDEMVTSSPHLSI